MKKHIKLYFSKECASNMPIHTKDLEDVYFISGNIGEYNNGEWTDTDDGFLPLEKLSVLLFGKDVLKVAKNFSAFLDKGEWFFEDEGQAKVFYEKLCSWFKEADYKLID